MVVHTVNLALWRCRQEEVSDPPASASWSVCATTPRKILFQARQKDRKRVWSAKCHSCAMPHKTGVTSFELSFIGSDPIMLVLLALSNCVLWKLSTPEAFFPPQVTKCRETEGT